MGQYKTKNYEGVRFGRVVVLERAENDKHGQPCQRCLCDCGKVFIANTYALVHGRTKSCGCLLRESVTKRFTTHGKSKTRIYRIFRGMHQRCENPNCASYKDYGARGIKVCPRWSDFENFEQDANAAGYSDSLTIERKDVNGDYCPENCEWIPLRDQCRNKRDVEMYEGKISTEWELELGLPLRTIRNRRLYYSKSLAEVVEAYKQGDAKNLFPDQSRSNVLMFDGRNQSEWARELGVSPASLVYYRKTHNCDLKAAVEHYQNIRATDKEA